MEDMSLRLDSNQVSRMSLTDMLQGVLLGHIVHFLHIHDHLSYFDCESGSSAIDHALALGLDSRIYVELLEFVSRSSDVLLPMPADADGPTYDHDTFRLNPVYSPYGRFGHYIDKFMGAYGGQLQHVGEVLREPRRAHSFTDDEALCTAFTRVSEEGGICASAHPMFHFMDDVCISGGGGLLDLGCGPGSLLLEAAAHMSEGAHHWGVDLSPAMCRTARRRVTASNLDDRISIAEGNVRSLSDILSSLCDETNLSLISAVHCGSIVNEFVWADEEVVAFLAEIRALFPATPLYISDYYGILGGPSTGFYGRVCVTTFDFTLTKFIGKEPWDTSDRDHFTLSMLHDVIQSLSGQGVPPKSVGDWEGLYDSAGYHLADYYEFPRGRSFIHVLTPRG